MPSFCMKKKCFTSNRSTFSHDNDNRHHLLHVHDDNNIHDHGRLHGHDNLHVHGHDNDNTLHVHLRDDGIHNHIRHDGDDDVH